MSDYFFSFSYAIRPGYPSVEAWSSVWVAFAAGDLQDEENQ